MANPEQATEPASMSVAELRRRLLASTPPPLSVSSANIDLDASPGSARSSMSRLTMPSQAGPVAASTVAPVLDHGEIPDIPAYPSRFRPMPNPATTPSLGSVETELGPPAPSILLPPGANGAATSSSKQITMDDYKKIKQENREIRKLLEEMKTLLQEASDSEQKYATREQENLAVLAEKQRQLDDLNAQMQLIEEQVSSGALAPAPSTPKTRDELEEWADELEKENARLRQDRRKLDEDRQQLREDEEALETQMREMEVSMARERALLARQETELKRLSAEIQHELEIMQRGDASLREQLSKFQRRAADVMQGKIVPGGRK